MALISNLQFTGSARTQVPLSNFATTPILDVSQYQAGEIVGWISIVATVRYRFWFSAKFAKNGAENDYWISPSAMGDAPPAGFSVSVTPQGWITVFLPNIPGFVDAKATYALDAPAVGAEYPLMVDSSNLTHATATESGVVSPIDQTFGGVKTFQDPPVINNASGIVAASPTAAGVITTGAQTIGGAKTFQDPPVIGNASGIVAASASAAGVVTTAAQSFAGLKTFSDGAVIKGQFALPSAQNIGEVRAFTSRTVTTTAAGTWATNASVLDTLTAGVWLVIGHSTINNLTSMTAAATGIDTANNTSAPSVGIQNWIGYNPLTGRSDNKQMGIFTVVVPSGSTQALYAKAVTVGAVGSNCSVSGFAIRMA